MFKYYFVVIILITTILLTSCGGKSTPLRQEVIQNLKGNYCGKKVKLTINTDSTFVCMAKVVQTNGKMDGEMECKGFYSLTYSEDNNQPLWTIKLSGKTSGMGVGVSCTGNFVCWSEKKGFSTEEFRDVMFNEPLSKCP